MQNTFETIRSIGKTYRNIGRFRKILSVLLANGFGNFFRDLRMLAALGLNPKDIDNPQASVTEDELANRIRNTLIELGPTFVKLGQILSCRPDILPLKFVKELEKLRDKVTPFPFEKVREIIREDLHGEIEDFFSSFEETPSGAASIAQGHRAKLKDGTEVFVKVQRPGIRKDILVDLEILRYFAAQLEKNNEELSFLKPTKIVDEFAEGLERELDFNNERTNMITFAKQFHGNEGIWVPKPYNNLCSPRVLTMDFVKGIRPDDVEGIRNAGMDPNTIAELGAKLLLAQFFEYGFFHGDPHAGNMFVLEGQKICYIDFGDMGRLTEDEKSRFIRLMSYVVMGDNKSATRIIMSMATSELKIDPDELERSMTALIDCHLRGDLQDLNVVLAVQDFYAICHKHRMCLKPHVYKMLKALGYADDMGRKLAPDFAIINHVKPFVMSQAMKRLNMMHWGKEAVMFAEEWYGLMKWLPDNIRPFVEKLVDGKIHFNHNLENFINLEKSLKVSASQLCASIIIASMLVSSALLAHAHIEPQIRGVSVLGIMGFLAAFVLGCILLVNIVISNRE